MRNHVVRCSWWLNFRCDTHFGRSWCCAQTVSCSPLTAHLEGTVEQAKNDKQRERNKKKHAEKGDIKMVVANVTAPQRHWPILVKAKADWLALTEVRVRQREIPLLRAQLLNSGCDSERMETS